MFVQSERFVEEHGGRIGDIAIEGQASNYTVWRLAKMNLAVRGIDADFRWNNEGRFTRWLPVHRRLEPGRTSKARLRRTRLPGP